MNLTGKCKEDFEKYLNKLRKHETKRKFADIDMILDSQGYGFDNLPESMQYGVYIDFFDSVDVRIDLISVGEPTMGGFNFFGHRFLINGFKANLTYINTRPEARTAAIEKANKIYNSK